MLFAPNWKKLAFDILYGVKTDMDCRLWNESEWSNRLNYVVVKFIATPAGSTSACLQRLCDFRNWDVMCDPSIVWEDRGNDVIREVHGRYAEESDSKYQRVCELIQLMEGTGIFDEVQYIPRERNDECRTGSGPDDDYGGNISDEECSDTSYIVSLSWGKEYRGDRAENKVTFAMNDPDKMGAEEWNIDTKELGVLRCRYETSDEGAFWKMAHKMMNWKKVDRTAFSDMSLCKMQWGQCTDITYVPLSNGNGSEGGEGKREEVKQPNPFPNQHRGGGGLSLITYKKGAYPVHRSKSAWAKLQRQRAAEDLRESVRRAAEELRELKDMDSGKAGGEVDDSSEESDESSSDGSEARQTAAKHKERQRMTKLKRKYIGLTDEPTNKWDRKLEKIANPRMYAMRIDKFDIEKRKKNVYYDRWVQLRDEKSPRGVEKLLAIGGGRLFNGYYVLKRHDFYFLDKGGKNGPELLRMVPYLDGEEFPKFDRYYFWYHNCIYNDTKDPWVDRDGNYKENAYVGSDWVDSESDEEVQYEECADGNWKSAWYTGASARDVEENEVSLDGYEGCMYDLVRESDTMGHSQCGDSEAHDDSVSEESDSSEGDVCVRRTGKPKRVIMDDSDSD